MENYDPTTAAYLGAYTLDFTQDPSHRADGLADPFGFAFSSDGMNLYYVQQKNAGVDRITYRIECSFGIITCSSDPTASIGAQVELAKQNITQNVSVILEDLRDQRNRDNEDLSSHNININYPNPLLKSLASKFEPSLKNNLAALVSNTEKKEKKNKSKWSSWSLGDIYFGDFDKHGFEKAKKIYSKGLTFGADRKFGNNKFFGWALRYGHQDSDRQLSVQQTDMDSFTVNLYGIIPRNNNQYINAVLGFSSLHFDNFYNSKLSSERHGKQVFTALNYRTKNTYGRFNITPSGKFIYGITNFEDYTDFISKTTDAATTDIIYKDHTFESGELAAGFLFEMEQIKFNDGIFQPMGAVEYLYNLTPASVFEYSPQGSSTVNRERISGKYSKESLKTNIGFEMIYSNVLKKKF